MWRIASILLLGLVAGCAARQHAPRTVSASWSTVQGLAPGTNLAVYLGEQEARYGALEVVADETLTIRGNRGLEALSRANIQRIAVRIATGSSRKAPIVQTALIGAAISGGLALFAAGMAENPPHNEFKWPLFLAGTAGGAAIGATRAPRETFSERLVYVRP